MIENVISGFDLQTIATQLVMICVSILIGTIIGAEREYKNKSAGLRTFILVSFGSCIFTILSIRIGVSNPDRLAANIITGIGFLGAGVIFKDSTKIEGITTATTIWATASLGMSAGAGHIYLALLGTGVVIIILKSLMPLQKLIDSHHKIREYKITTATITEFERCMTLFHEYHLKSLLINEQKSPEGFSRTWQVTGTLKNHDLLVSRLVQDPGILSYQF
ncbi:MgtC/SapB family protein [Niabella drilacis]|uniref:Putative Mg2+ transporter-C (MgtC) family protein n=1 Tax=Niabella drilacis (strain DSM 25811 / CCM 8410 / CCUG 62505 / LMG 26954 / E90) TaxID=1285928 RepID=A0A1G6KQD5_NIADE|nr:MgtC/SapB family protein [Niabella drilacis]SDC32735.1 putative Mg2+ transporter-C (MgtC) family protein [Niabella drilacis]